MIKVEEKLVNRQVYITYNPVYKVPVLWFNLYSRGTSPPGRNLTLLSFSKKDEIYVQTAVRWMRTRHWD